MSKKDSKIEEKIVALFNAYEDDDEIDEFLEECEDEYSEDIRDFAFREAIRQGITEYIENHIDDFDLMDNGDSSSYLDETDDEDIQELLMSYGAARSFDDYTDCKFAVETVNDNVLSYDRDFQEEVFKKYLSVFDLTSQSIVEMFLDAGLVENFEKKHSRDFKEDMSLMGISVQDRKIKFSDRTDWSNNGNGIELYELIEKLGWECEFEGDSWKFETRGVYFIK